MAPQLAVYLDDRLAKYGFPDGHPFSESRYFAFKDALLQRELVKHLMLSLGKRATEEELLFFHTQAHVDFVKKMSHRGTGYLDQGDTPAFPGMYEIACTVVGTTLDAAAKIASGYVERAFVPIAGLHHGYRDHAEGFCVFNDIGVAIEMLRRQFAISTIAYIDIDVHHGNGVFYSFEDDPALIFADIHQEGIYPGSGFAAERGTGLATGKKLNIPLPPFSGDDKFFAAFERITHFVDIHRPEFIILQCGADSLKNDPLASLRYSEKAHGHAARTMRVLAEKHARGRLLALGGGGYNLDNIAAAWTEVVSELM